MSRSPKEDYTCSRDYHLFSRGPKRILALDGGGVRGAISVAFLERIEKLLDERMGRKVRLADWFDLIGGTSTGAIIAGALALGHRVEEVRDFYLRLAPKVFAPRWSIPYLQAKFDARGLRTEIDNIVQDRTLDSDDLITGLAIISKRIDTGSPWIIANNPMSKFWGPEGGHLPNKDYKLATLVRASTAAPLYFDPEIIAITPDAPIDPLGKITAPFSGHPWAALLLTKIRALYGLISPQGPSAKTHGLFVDGGVTPYNNPSMALLMLVALEQFGIRWDLGPQNLTIISIGTGAYRTKLSFGELGFAGPLKLAKQAMLSSIGDAQSLAVAQMQWLGECPIRWPINTEIGTLEGNSPPGGPWFRFMRYDVALDSTGLEAFIPHAQESEVRRLQEMDSVEIIEELYKIGGRVAEDLVQPEHLFPPPKAAGATSAI
jgi:uncharacterized protein